MKIPRERREEGEHASRMDRVRVEGGGGRLRPVTAYFKAATCVPTLRSRAHHITSAVSHIYIKRRSPSTHLASLYRRKRNAGAPTRRKVFRTQFANRSPILRSTSRGTRSSGVHSASRAHGKTDDSRTRVHHHFHSTLKYSRRMKMNNSYASFLMLFLVIGIAVGSESYLDYGDEAADRNLENLRELYRILLRRNAVENTGLVATPLEHLMIRKSQRSPSLRLRFGRSGPPVPTRLVTRPGDNPSAFDDN